MAESVKQRLVLNSLYSAASTVVPVVLALVATPIIVRSLGNEMYGLYAVILGFTAYSFTFAVGKSASKYVAEFRASGQREKLSETVSSIFWLSVGLAVSGAILSAALAETIVTRVLQIPDHLRDVSITAFYLACSIIVVTMLSQVFQFVLQGAHRFDLYVLLTNIGGLALNLGSVFLVLNGYGLLALLSWNLFITTATGAMFYFYAIRFVPDLTLRVSIKSEIWWPVLGYGASIISYQIFGNALLLFERGWIVRRLGPELLTFYVIPMTVGWYLHALVGSLVLALFPVINELRNDREKLVRLYKTATKICLAIAILAVATSAIAGRLFLRVWLSEDFASTSTLVLLIHIATFAVLSVATVTLQISESVGKTHINAIATFVWMAIAVLGMIAFVEHFGIQGIAAARFAGVLAFIPFIVYIEKHFLGGFMWSFWLSSLGKIAVAATVTCVAQMLSLQLLNGWPGIILAAGSGALTYLAALHFVRFLDKEEAAIIRTMTKRVMPVTAS